MKVSIGFLIILGLNRIKPEVKGVNCLSLGLTQPIFKVGVKGTLFNYTTLCLSLVDR